MVEWYWQGKTEVLGEKHYTAWVVDGWMSMEQWWNDTDRGKLKYCEKICSSATLRYIILKIHILKFDLYLTLYPPPPHGTTEPDGSEPSHYRGSTITLRHTTVGRTSQDEWSARRRDIYPKSHNAQCFRRDSNPQSQQVSDSRASSSTARPLGPALINT